MVNLSTLGRTFESNYFIYFKSAASFKKFHIRPFVNSDSYLPRILDSLCSNLCDSFPKF